LATPCHVPTQPAIVAASNEPAADDHPDARDLGRFVRADDASQGVAVDDRKARDADRRGMREQFFAGRRAPQEREVRRALELEITHAKIP